MLSHLKGSKKSDKIDKATFKKKLDVRQWRMVIPETQETNKARLIALREFRNCSMGATTKAEPEGFHKLRR